MEIAVISLTFLVLMAFGIPIGTCLGIAAVVTIYQFDLGIGMLGINFSTGIASFPLLAIPFFVLAGVILEKAGLAATIARFFELLVGKAVGGLAMVAVLTCMFWGSLSGSKHRLYNLWKHYKCFSERSFCCRYYSRASDRGGYAYCGISCFEKKGI